MGIWAGRWEVEEKVRLGTRVRVVMRVRDMGEMGEIARGEFGTVFVLRFGVDH